MYKTVKGVKVPTLLPCSLRSLIETKQRKKWLDHVIPLCRVEQKEMKDEITFEYRPLLQFFVIANPWNPYYHRLCIHTNTLKGKVVFFKLLKGVYYPIELSRCTVYRRRQSDKGRLHTIQNKTMAIQKNNNNNVKRKY